MNTFNYFYGVTITIIFKTQRQFIQNTSKVFYCIFLGKEIADLILHTINSLLSESEFEIL